MHFIPAERLSRWPHFHEQFSQCSGVCCVGTPSLLTAAKHKEGKTSLYRDGKMCEVMHVLQRPAQRLMLFHCSGLDLWLCKGAQCWPHSSCDEGRLCKAAVGAAQITAATLLASLCLGKKGGRHRSYLLCVVCLFCIIKC